MDDIKAFVMWANEKQRYMFKVTKNNEPVAIGWDTTEKGARRQAYNFVAKNFPTKAAKLEVKSE